MSAQPKHTTETLITGASRVALTLLSTVGEAVLSVLQERDALRAEAEELRAAQDFWTSCVHSLSKSLEIERAELADWRRLAEVVRAALLLTPDTLDATVREAIQTVIAKSLDDGERLRRKGAEVEELRAKLLIEQPAEIATLERLRDVVPRGGDIDRIVLVDAAIAEISALRDRAGELERAVDSRSVALSKARSAARKLTEERDALQRDIDTDALEMKRLRAEAEEARAQAQASMDQLGESLTERDLAEKEIEALRKQLYDLNPNGDARPVDLKNAAESDAA